MKRTTLALVVPGLTSGGGVTTVARFVKRVALQSGHIEVRPISLAMGASDTSSVRITAPTSWLDGVKTTVGAWEGLSFVHVGAAFSEVEFQRYRRRPALEEALADCELIQVVCGSAAWANAVCGLGKPVSLQVATRALVERRHRDRKVRGPVDLWRRQMTRITDWLDDRALRSVDAIQIENRWMLEYATKINRGREVDIRYAPPGVNTTLFHPLERRRPTHDPYILCVGRLDDPRKRIGLLLEAYAKLPQGFVNSTDVVLAGASEPPTAFWRRAEDLRVRHRITYVPRPDEATLVSLYQRASAFVFPSDEEGLGIVLLEAMACGIPAVSTRSGGPDDVITDGHDGFLVPVDDAVEMADRVARLLEQPDLNIRMGHEARRTVEARYADGLAGDAFLDSWERLVDRRRSS